MTRARCAALAVGLLTACSGGGEAGNAQQASVGVSGPAAAPDRRSETAPAADPLRGSGLRAQVSDLTADVSGLNTRMSDMGLVIDLPADAVTRSEDGLPGLQLLPHRHNTDGFFAAVWRKKI